MTRPDWDDYFLGIAKAVASRADCTRRKVGAVIVDTERRIASTGYNGSKSGGPSCLAGDCPRGRHYQIDPPQGDKFYYGEIDTPGCDCGHWRLGLGWHADACTWVQSRGACACGKRWPCPDAVAPGSSYDTGSGSCVALHAEQNALLYCDRERLDGATIYVTEAPCDGCYRLLGATKIARYVWMPGNSEATND